MSLLSWNINGVKSKFEFAPVKELFLTYDFIIISETHFKTRIKIPEKFTLVCKSRPINLDFGVGGVAVYRNKLSSYEVEYSCDIFDNFVIFDIKGTNTIIVAVYIPAINSKYYTSNPIYFKNLALILDFYKNKTVHIVGDMNARTGTPVLNNRIYKVNPDYVVNSHGRPVLRLCTEDMCCIINGLWLPYTQFDSKLTFFRGRVSSQNDLCLSTCPAAIQSFHILDKLSVSDHTPCSLTVKVKSTVSIDMIKDLSAGNLDYSHYDNSTYIKKCVSLKNINATVFIRELSVLAEIIEPRIDDNSSNCNAIAEEMQEGIYIASRKAKASVNLPVIIDQGDNRTSKHFTAIYEANFKMYKYLLHSNGEASRIQHYANQWIKFEI